MSELRTLAWRKSRRSIGTGECVEVASGTECIAVRDSKNPDGPVLAFITGSWRTFTRAAQNSNFDGLR